MNTTFNSAGVENTILFGRILGAMLHPGAVVVLSGPLGAGKTVLVKGIALGLGIDAGVVSPSYTIAAEYSGRLPLTHVDLYRTGSDEELELLGFDELVNGDGVTVIEWGEKAANFLDAAAIQVTVTIGGENERRIDVANIKDEFCRRLTAGLTGTGL